MLWTWSNFHDASALPGLCKVRINFDETGVSLFHDSKVGHMVAAARARKRSGQSLTRGREKRPGARKLHTCGLYLR